MKITESQLRHIIRESLDNLRSYDIGEAAKEQAVYLENKIDILNYRVKMLLNLGEIIEYIKGELSNFFGDNISQPIMKNEYMTFSFVNPLEYNEEGNLNIGSGYIENDIKEMFPNEYRNYIEVYTNETEKGISGFEIYFDIDSMAEID